MAKVLVDDSNLTAIGDAIRTKNGSSDTYKPREMPAAISRISVGTDTTISSSEAATETDIAEGKKAWVNDKLIKGIIKSRGGANDTYNSIAYTANSQESDSQYYSFTATNNSDILLRKNAVISMNYLKNNFGDAEQQHVLSGKYFTSSNGIKLQGTYTPPSTPLINGDTAQITFINKTKYIIYIYSSSGNRTNLTGAPYSYDNFWLRTDEEQTVNVLKYSIITIFCDEGINLYCDFGGNIQSVQNGGLPIAVGFVRDNGTIRIYKS